jgi:hypothetical protein
MKKPDEKKQFSFLFQMELQMLWIRIGRVKKAVSLFIFGFILLSYSVFGGDIYLNAVVEKDVLSVGESFIYQIQIEGSDKISGFPKNDWGNDKFQKEFAIEFLGSQNNSSRQISIINGRRTEIINTGYLVSWSLIPLITGTLTIPSVSLTIDGDKFSTRPVSIRSKEAEESDDLKFLVSLDKDQCYVGEPLLMTFTWYIGMNVNEFSFSIPFFGNANFSFSDVSMNNEDPENLVRFPLGKETITAFQGRSSLKGKTYTTVTFSKFVVPKKSGDFIIPKSIISVSAEKSSRSGGNDFFNSFFSSLRPEYEQFSVPSNDLFLKVLQLPETGRPDIFTGYIGELEIETSASPLNVRVGDPITLTMIINGPKNFDYWDAPNLEEQTELAANFKMPSEISAGKVENEKIIFTRTIRALNERITEIPAIGLSYFDAERGTYSIALSKAIPISVKKGSSVEVEGLSDSDNLQQDIIQSSNEGINFNYRDLSVLRNQSFGFGTIIKIPYILLLIFPPLGLLLTLIIKFIGRRNYFSTSSSNKKAIILLKKKLNTIDTSLGISIKSSGNSIKNIFQKFLSSKTGIKKAELGADDFSLWVKNSGFLMDDFPLVFAVFKCLDEIQFAASVLSDQENQVRIMELLHEVKIAAEDFDRSILK